MKDHPKLYYWNGQKSVLVLDRNQDVDVGDVQSLSWGWMGIRMLTRVMCEVYPGVE